MQDLISIAIIIATLFGGTYTAKKIYDEIRVASLTKASQGLHSLSKFSHQLTKKKK